MLTYSKSLYFLWLQEIKIFIINNGTEPKNCEEAYLMGGTHYLFYLTNFHLHIHILNSVFVI